MKRTLKNKLVISGIIITLVVGVLVSLAIFFYMKNVLINSRIDEIIKIHEEKVNEYKIVFQNHQTFTMMLGTRTRVMEFLLDRSEARRAELDGIFMEYAKNNPQYLALYLLDDGGNTLISTDRTFVGQNYAFREYFTESMSGREYAGAFLGITSNDFGYYFSYPVKDKEKIVIGVVVVKLNPDEINKFINESQIAQESKLMLSDTQGIIIGTNKEGAFFKSFGKLNDATLEGIT
jgi:C4-dicarboxylate-specific signal transduction histidine kinase